MLFTEPTFLFLFLPILLGLYFAPAIGRGTARTLHGAYGNWLLLIASIIFYAKGGGSFTWLMLASIAFNYWMAIAVDRARHAGASPAIAARRAKQRVAFAVAVNLIVLGIFKYANFFAANVNTLFLALHAQPVVVPRVLLPIGISFFTFHAISYVVDVYRHDATAQKSPVHAALYLLLFPQLIAGPIIRYRDIADQLALRMVTVDDFGYGVRRFVIGLAKKVLIANVVAGPADRIFALPAAEISAGHAWLAIVCYTLQIYFDFSGYSDMAIGLGRMFGFRFPENFRWPYVAGSVQEFWRRWHLSLSTWFRDYLYIPLGGNRVSPGRQYRNLVTVFFLCGLWHGASWNFVIWGLWHGAFLVIERIASGKSTIVTNQQSSIISNPPIRNKSAISNQQSSIPLFGWPIWPHLYTMAVVMIGWVFFRAETLASAVAFLEALAGITPTVPTPYSVGWYLTPELWLALIAGAIGSTPWVPAVARRVVDDRAPLIAHAMPLVNTAALAALLFASILQLAARTYNPFIYFRF
ncbi:MAG TPA: MBOAT family O-acyltransferase [Vicinamibacterales bacterium]|nr:MBOAT family O-acyltransferase [Vicinamibacterales bacterium]